MGKFAVIFCLLFSSRWGLADPISSDELQLLVEALTPLNCGSYAKELLPQESAVVENRYLRLPNLYFDTKLTLHRVTVPAILNDQHEVTKFNLEILSVAENDFKKINLKLLRMYINWNFKYEYPHEGIWSIPAIKKVINGQIYILLFSHAVFWFREAYPPYVTQEELDSKCFLSSLYNNSPKDLFFDQPNEESPYFNYNN